MAKINGHILNFVTTGLLLCCLATPALANTPSDLSAQLLDPNMLNSCDTQIIEIGPTSQNSFNPQFAMLRDTWGSGYQGLPPKIRMVYDYRMDPFFVSDSSFFKTISKFFATILTLGTEANSAIPAPVLMDMDHYQAHSVKHIIYELFVTAAKFANIGALPLYAPVLPADEVITAYRNNQERLRAGFTYDLQLMLDENNTSLAHLVGQSEIQKLIARGDNYANLKGWTLDKDIFAQRVYKFRNVIATQRNRSENSANLLFRLNAINLDALPLNKDFVLVVCDPARNADCSKVNLSITDLSPVSAKTPVVDGLYIMGLFALNKPDGRLLIGDFDSQQRLRNRTIIKDLYDIGEKLNTLFLPLPLSIVITASEEGVKFFVSKSGNKTFSDILDSQAEIEQLLDSGLVHSGLIQFDGDVVRTIRQQIEIGKFNIFTNTATQEEAYRKTNAANVARFVDAKSPQICKKVGAERQSDFNSMFLAAHDVLFTKVTNVFKTATLQRPTSAASAEKRNKIISEKYPIMAAREILKNYSPSQATDSVDDVVHSLTVLGTARQAQDVAIISKTLLNTKGDYDIESAALLSIGYHGNKRFLATLQTYFQQFDPKLAALDETHMKLAFAAVKQIAANSTPANYDELNAIYKTITPFESVQNYNIALEAYDTLVHLHVALTNIYNR